MRSLFLLITMIWSLNASAYQEKTLPLFLKDNELKKLLKNPFSRISTSTHLKKPLPNLEPM